SSCLSYLSSYQPTRHPRLRSSGRSPASSRKVHPGKRRPWHVHHLRLPRLCPSPWMSSVLSFPDQVLQKQVLPPPLRQERLQGQPVSLQVEVQLRQQVQPQLPRPALQELVRGT